MVVMVLAGSGLVRGFRLFHVVRTYIHMYVQIRLRQFHFSKSGKWLTPLMLLLTHWPMRTIAPPTGLYLSDSLGPVRGSMSHAARGSHVDLGGGNGIDRAL